MNVSKKIIARSITTMHKVQSKVLNTVASVVHSQGLAAAADMTKVTTPAWQGWAEGEYSFEEMLKNNSAMLEQQARVTKAFMIDGACLSKAVMDRATQVADCADGLHQSLVKALDDTSF